MAVTTRPLTMRVSKPIAKVLREKAESALYVKLPHLRDSPSAAIKNKILKRRGRGDRREKLLTAKGAKNVRQERKEMSSIVGKSGAHMQFGITIKPDMTVARIVSLTRQAEAAGFEYGWIFDSHVLWLEPYPLLTLMAANTKKMHLGPCMTNPAVRDITVTSSLFATLNIISGGRMELGIGRGDSARRVLGKKPVTSAHLEESVQAFRELTSGHEIEYEGRPTKISWAQGSPRVWIAGYGPKVLDLAGRVGDGVILQFADPDLIEWGVGFVKKGAEAAGRDFKKIEVMAATAVWVSD